MNDFISYKSYNANMKSILFIAIAFLSMQVIADDKARPAPHNKIGHTKKSDQEKKDSFIYKLWNNESDIMGSNNRNQSFNDGNTEILSQIEKLADLRDRGVITETEFVDKKTILLEKIR
tara:strand:- start:44 stop:400 length:357 start_codon:yes stop_codon:yes gene_type:complete